MAKQLLHLVFGGELTSLDKVEFRDLDKIHFVGLYPNFAKAREAWKAAAQATVDNAHMRYFVVHLHKILQPELEAGETLSAPAKAARPAPAARSKVAKTGKSGPAGGRK
jgi:protein-disulfide isomerase